MEHRYSHTPPGVGEVHLVLWVDVALLHQRWTTFRMLFVDSSIAQRQTLEWAADGFFTLLQRILLDDVLLGIARLADPISTGGKANLVLASLPAALPSDCDVNLQKRVADLVQQYHQATAFALPVRNKRLAHRDLMVAIGQSTDLTYKVAWSQIETALGLASTVLNSIDSHFEGRTTLFGEFIHHKGADVLLGRLTSSPMRSHSGGESVG